MAASFIDGYLIEWWWQQEVRLKFAEPRPSTFFLLPTSLFVFGLDNNTFFIVNEGALRRFHLYFRLGCWAFLTRTSQVREDQAINAARRAWLEKHQQLSRGQTYFPLEDAQRFIVRVLGWPMFG